MNRIFLILALALPLAAYTEKTELRLAAGVNAIYICDSGPNAGSPPACYVQGLPVDAGHRAHVWPSIAGYNCGADGDCTSIVDCTDEAGIGVPCSILINREYGDIKLWVRIYTAADGSPGTLSSKILIPGVNVPCEVATFVVPSDVHGFENKQICKTFSIAGGEDVSQLQLWMQIYNWRNGAFDVTVGNAAPVTYLDNPVLSFVCLATNVCTVKTQYPHGYVATQSVQFNGYLPSASAFAAAQVNNTQTVQTVVDANTFTITQPVASCLGISCTFNSPSGQANGITTSAFYYDNEDRWIGGVSGIPQAMEVSQTIPNGALVAGTTNTIKWRLNTFRYPAYAIAGMFGGYILRWNVVQPWQSINKITVSGCPGACVATVTLNGTVPAAWHIGDTVVLRDPNGPEWLFSHERVITGPITASTFQFSLTQPTVGSWVIPNGDYVVPTSKDTTIQTQPVAWAARALISTASFRALNPATDYVTAGNAAAGLTAATTGTLKTLLDYFPNHASGAHCTSCHSDTLYDLKYFSFPPSATIVDALERGKIEQDAVNIATYIQSLAVPYTGRPWDPPYQPGIGLDSTPLLNMAAGAGLQWKANYDQDIRWYLVPGCTPTTSGCTGGSYAKAVNPGGSGGGAASSIINTRELPTALQMPQWLRWLPIIAPEDLVKVTGRDFIASPAYATDYTTYKSNTSTAAQLLVLPANCTAASVTVVSGTNFHNNDFVQILDITQANKFEYWQITAGGGTTSWTVSRCQKGSAAQAWAGNPNNEFITNFTVYWNTNGAYTNLFNDVNGECGAGCGSYGTPGATHYASFSRPEFSASPSPCGGGTCAGYWYPSILPLAIISAYDFGLVKTWDLVQSHYLYNMLDQVYIAYKGTTPNARAAAQDTRGYAFKWPFNRGPHKLIGGTQFLGNTGAVTSRFFDCDTEIWYRLPGVIDNGNRMGGGDVEYDQNYYWAFFTTGSCGIVRPHFYDVATIAFFLPQQMWGLPLLTNMALNAQQLVNQIKTGFWGNNLFTPDAEEAEVAQQLAVAYYNLSTIDTQNTAEWQTMMNSGTNCSTSATTTANAVNGFNQDGCYLDEIAYGLTVMTFYGANSTTMSNIVAWLDPVWSAFSGAGHTFAKYTNAVNVAAKCSKTNIGGHAPTSVSCVADGVVWP